MASMLVHVFLRFDPFLKLVFFNCISYCSSQFMMLNPGETLKGDKFIRHHTLHCDIDFEDVTFTYPTRKDHVSHAMKNILEQ